MKPLKTAVVIPTVNMKHSIARYTMTCYENISNKSPSGVFEYVRCVTLFDEHPFEHIFFYRTAHRGPLQESMKK